LAIGSAVSTHLNAAGVRRPSGLAAKLGAEQVAVPVTITDGSAAGFIHVGDHVGLFAAPADSDAPDSPGSTLIADRLKVVSVLATEATDSGQTILVATDRETATRIAAAIGGKLLAVLDNSPP
jgi:hypothetical protein